ncbi:phage replication protein [Enterococcus sp.]|uniref:phage replication protein n=1 Tax=Enterococcus sp. TaxID=35783 RepID=UPI002FC5FAFA
MAEALNIRQDRFLKALLESPSIEKACKLAGINKSTGYKYLKDSHFMAEYRALRREAMQQVTARLQKASEEAVAVLKEVMLDKEAAPNARVQSAKNVLDIAYRSIELDDIQEQLDELKHTVGEAYEKE